MGTTAQHEQLVSESQILTQQIPAGLKCGTNQTERKDEPMEHAAQDSPERPRTQDFSDCTEFLPTTACEFAAHLLHEATDLTAVHRVDQQVHVIGRDAEIQQPNIV
jgi:ATP-dependent Clp protease ATP-binding subunit ClpA